MKLRNLLFVALGAALLCTVSCDKDKKGFSGDPVDLGLSIRWADLNVGAIVKDDAGSSVTYDEAVDYAAQSKKWSIPTQQQWEELLNTEGVQVQRTLDPAGFLIIGKDGMSIFFPGGTYLSSTPSTDGGIVYVDMAFALTKPVFRASTNKSDKFCVRLVRK